MTATAIRIPLTAVKSSNIKAVGYDVASQTLAVQFSSGKTYLYKGVSADDANKLMNAESVGSHFAMYIRPRFTGVLQPEELARG